MSVIKWKDSQLQVIKEKEGEILVSASAGSGKTAVMIERLIRLIEDGVSVDNVLCLTYTEAAAKEIKDRLRSSLTARIEISVGKERERFVRELDRLAFADISTIDGFCRRIVKRYFEKAKEDPTVGVASKDESKNIMYRAAERVLGIYAETGDVTFGELIDFLGKNRSEKSVLELIIRINEFLSTLAGRGEFVDSVKNMAKVNGYDSVVVVLEIERAVNRLRRIENLALDALKWDLPYPEDVLLYVRKVSDALDKGVNEFFEQTKKEIPSSPSYNRLPYSRKKESQRDLFVLRGEMDKFIKAFSSDETKTVEQDLAQMSRYTDKIFELVEALRCEYEKALNSANLIDFSGMENKALLCLEDEEIRRDVEQRYAHVLVDEYQDTNRLQDGIISLCAGGKSLFMVGDAKQSIYEFRHAEPAIFVEKKKKIGIKNHSLQENFRSDGEIIEAVNKVFLAVYDTAIAGEEYKGQEMKTERIGAKSEFPAVSCNVFFSSSERDDSSREEIYSVMTHVADTPEQESEECAFVCDKIKKLLDRGKIKDKNGIERGIELGDIAILSRSRSKTVREITDSLKRMGMPVSIRQKCNLPYSAELLIHLLKVVDNPLREDSLVCAMLSPLFDFTENELAKYKIEGNSERGLYGKLLSLQGKYPKLDGFLSTIEDYKFRSEYGSVAELLAYIIKDREFEISLAETEEGNGEIGELDAYLDALESSPIAESLTEYLNYFDKFPYFETERKTGSENAISIMTIHASKGLEFPVVFMVDMGANFNIKDTYHSVLLHKKYGMAISTFDPVKRIQRKNFFTEAVKRKMKDDVLAQELRLLYVGMTRARNILCMSGKAGCNSEDKLKNKTDERDAGSMLDFILIAKNKDESINKAIDFVYGKGEYAVEEVKENNGESFEQDDKILSDCKELLSYAYAYNNATITPAKFTVTGLTAQKSDEDDIPATPLTVSASAEEGTLYHTVMENINFSLNSLEEINKALDKMLLDNIITQKEREQIDESLLLRVLSTEVIKEASSRECMREQGFLLRESHATLVGDGIDDEVLLQGVIDLLVLGDEPIIVDYKYSGAGEKALRERYSEQIRLYKLAVKDILGVNKVRCCILSLKTAEVIEF